MQERIASLRAEYEQLQQQLQDPSTHGDPQKVIALSRRSAQLRPLMELLKEKESAMRSIAAVGEVGDDPELLALAKEEADAAQVRLAQIDAAIEEELIPRDADDDRSVVVEVRAGTGGDEASLFASELLRMYLRYAEAQGWKAETLDLSKSESGGVREAVARIEGVGAYGKLKHESGVHRVQRIPETENKGRIHTSTATVAVLPEVEEVDIDIRTQDLRIDTFRAGGAGGQHVNKTESAVRITHIPSGVVVACQSERSQLQNRARAMTLLRSRLYAEQQRKKAEELGAMRSRQVGSGDRNEKIRTYNFSQDRVTDHRIGQSFRNLPMILEGQIDEIVTSMQAYDRELRAEMEENG